MITYNNLGFNGRFGNQLFQFASTIGIARKRGFDVVFPKRNIISGVKQKLNNQHEFMARVDFTNYFNIDDKFFSDEINIKNNINEGHFHFNEKLFNIADFTNINGYLQSEKYFKHCSDEIKEILTPQKHFLDLAETFIPKTNKILTGVHIRRGDYITSNNNHPFVGLDYIKKSMEILGDENHFLICSDDIAWCVDEFIGLENCTIIDSKSQFIDFAILTKCNNFIISNSSFSWWASYLSNHNDKKIIAPKKWFGGTLKNTITKDLYRDEMILI